MTKSGKKDAPKPVKPKLEKETVKDLEPKQGENVKGGRNDSERVTCTCHCA